MTKELTNYDLDNIHSGAYYHSDVVSMTVGMLRDKLKRIESESEDEIYQDGYEEGYREGKDEAEIAEDIEADARADMRYEIIKMLSASHTSHSEAIEMIKEMK